MSKLLQALQVFQMKMAVSKNVQAPSKNTQSRNSCVCFIFKDKLLKCSAKHAEHSQILTVLLPLQNCQLHLKVCNCFTCQLRLIAATNSNFKFVGSQAPLELNANFADFNMR